ncbi:hypothetical protein MPSEU_001018900 [Mayamaea pseudoterrestris]|nr:hypothetical protein MPSEU_001018900 [Mayamaea pseudoterrestris]
MAKTKTKGSKGPKGTKARAKAKLERQWGEVDLGAQRKRVGKSRLLTRKTDRRSYAEHEPSIAGDMDEALEASQQVNNDDISDDEEQACSKLLQSLRQKANGEESDASSDSGSSDDDTSIMEIDNANPGENHLSTLLLHLDAFADRFSHASLAGNEEARSQQMIEIQGSEVKLHASKCVSLQVSKSLYDKLELSHESDLNWQCKVRTKALVHSSMRKVLQDQCANMSTSQSLLFPFASLYADMLVTTPTHSKDHTTFALHTLNHVLTSRGRIQRQNRRLQTIEAEQSDESDQSTWQRDQGYVRPTVLVLLPTRGCCYAFVKQLQSMLGDTAENERFETEFGPPIKESTDPTDKAELHRRKAISKKGKDWIELFGDDVNDDDDFKLGISLQENKQKKKNDDDNAWSTKLFSDFYKSDIIIASPIGLKMNANNKEEDERGFLFLSSIEVCLVLRGDVLLMQNWDHLNDLLPELNQQPQDTTDIDFSRVRNYLLDGQGSHWRQLIISSSFLDPAIASTFKRHAKSIAGIARFRHQSDNDSSSITNVLLPTQQVFQRVPTSSFLKHSEDRLRYFTEKVLAQILKSKQSHTLIFIPSYFDFISVRNRLLKDEASFVMVTEYSRHTETSRARARFLQGRKPIMLYTGRAHYFHRHFIKGAHHLVFLGLPEHSEFYPQMINLLNDGSETDDGASASCLALFTKYEKFALERIVGSKNSSNMLCGEKSTFLFS